MHIAPDIFQVGGQDHSSPEDAAVYLVADGDQAALVDAGCGGTTDRILDNITAAGVEPATIRWLLLTHCHFDHSGGAGAIRERLGCRLAAHEADTPFLEAGDAKVTAADWYGRQMPPLPVDHVIRGGGETFTLVQRRIEAIHMPGHSPGSVVYVTESDEHKIVFAQDVHGPLSPAFKSDAAAYRRSLEKLMALEADILCEGHFGVIHGKQAVKRFIADYLN